MGWLGGLKVLAAPAKEGRKIFPPPQGRERNPGLLTFSSPKKRRGGLRDSPRRNPSPFKKLMEE